MAILVARTNLPVWDFQKLASLVSGSPMNSPTKLEMTRFLDSYFITDTVHSWCKKSLESRY